MKLRYSLLGFHPSDVASQLATRRQIYETELGRAAEKLRAVLDGNEELRTYIALLEAEWLSQRETKEQLLSALTDRISHRSADAPAPSPPVNDSPAPDSLQAMEQELAACRQVRQEILTGVMALIQPFLTADGEADSRPPEMEDAHV